MRASVAVTRSSRALFRCTIPRPQLYNASKPGRMTTLLRPQLHQSFSSSAYAAKGISPDSSDPKPPNTEPSSPSLSSATAAELTTDEYHEIADRYLDSLVAAIEEKAEDPSTGIEVEFSAGVLTINHPRGTYVLNKQPPNKQIWLSSPVSGPKRYDWVEGGAGQHEKEGSDATQGDDGSGGRWIYLRDGSALSELLEDEVEVTFVQE